MKKTLAILSLLFCLHGCATGPSDAEVKTILEKGVLESMIERAEKSPAEGQPKPVAVSLIKKAEYNYTGFAEYSDGTRLDLTVTYDAEGNMIWKSGILAD